MTTLLFAACGQDDPCDAPIDVGVAWTCAEPLALDVGTGSSAFEPMDDGDVLSLHEGSQGLQHVYVSLRGAWDAASLATDRALVHLELHDGDATVAGPLDVGLGLTAREGGVEIVGALLVVLDEEVERVVDHELWLLAEAQPVGDEPARGARRVQVAWAQ